MSRILYGVSGEGSGHSSRARVMAGHLVDEGHEVRIATYDRGLENLAEFDPLEIEGLHIDTSDNRVAFVGTLIHNLRKVPSGWGKVQRLKRLFREWKPHCCITDFEPMTAYLANLYGVPLISLDNQHRIRYMRYPFPEELKRDRWTTLNVVRAMVPWPDVSLVTTFYFGEVVNDHTFLFPPILRKEIRDLKPRAGDGIIVYLTQGFDSLIESLPDYPNERFLFYGYHDDEVRGNVHYKRFDWQGFLDDLESCKAIWATAGYTLMTEAFHLGKPMMVFPMKGQFEQALNTNWLENLGFGMNGRPAGGEVRPETVAEFLERIPDFRAALAGYSHEDGDSSAMKAKLSELVADDAALAHEFRQRRRSRSRNDDDG